VTTVNASTPAVPLVSTKLRAPAWARLAPVGIGLLAAVVAFWSLTVSGYANTYYSAAAQAASQSWSAMFYGAIDAAGFITVDKPPVAIWAMGLSVRVLGLNPFAVLLPQALAGVGAALVLWAAVRRSFGPAAALIAGVAFALTPVAAVMFRYNNPDALLTLLLVAAAWALVRGLEDDRFRWPVLAATLVGFAFLTKYLQAYLVLPAFVLTYLVASRGGLRRRVTGLALSGAVVVISSFWWVAVVELVPASARPYVGGSASNSALDLILGYDGLGRIFGQGGGPGAGGPGGGGPGGGGAFAGGAFGGAPGLLRMFNAQWAGEISWLLPAAAVGLVTGLVARFRAPRTDARRAGYLLWGTWAIVHVVVFSFMSGVAHPYYAVAIAPAAAALTGAGIAELWGLRSRSMLAGIVLGAVLVGTAWWGLQVLDRTPDLLPGFGLAAVFVALAAAIILAVPPVVGDARAGLIARGALVVGVAAALVGPAIFTGTTMGKSLAGGDPAAGPTNGPFGGGFGGGIRPGSGGFPGDTAGTNDALAQYLVANRGGATWLVAVSSANQAGPLQLETGAPVMAMGGFMGSDPAPTLEQLKGYVRGGSLRFVLLGGRDGGPGGFFGGDGQGNIAGERTTWVTGTCTAVDIPGVAATLYDCAGAG
jgi:4-amino-4-deoxy-L-arabinose transferase-like glycosyltransferase